eukprot:COSAG06_NODE_4_length_41837_cov_204.557597_24_plen_60_part_00
MRVSAYRCAAAGVELEIDPTTLQLMAMKRKGLSQQLKPTVAQMIDDGLLTEAADCAEGW